MILQQSPTSAVEAFAEMDPAVPLAILGILFVGGIIAGMWMGVPWQTILLTVAAMLCLPIGAILGIAFAIVGILMLLAMLFTTPTPDQMIEGVSFLVVLGLSAAIFSSLGRGLMAGASQYIEPSSNGGKSDQ